MYAIDDSGSWQEVKHTSPMTLISKRPIECFEISIEEMYDLKDKGKLGQTLTYLHSRLTKTGKITITQ